jgi:hypothetical protein
MTVSRKNILTYLLQSEKQEHKLNGMLISDPLTVLSLNALAEENPLLKAEMTRVGKINNL